MGTGYRKGVDMRRAGGASIGLSLLTILPSLVVQRLRCPPVNQAPTPPILSGEQAGERAQLSAGDRGSTPRQRALPFGRLGGRVVGLAEISERGHRARAC